MTLDQAVLMDEASMLTRAIALPSLLTVCLLAPSMASAQALPTASILQTQRSEGVDEGTGSAFDRMLRQRLDQLGVVSVSGAVVLDLEQVQLALGCMGETVQCLAAVTTELNVQILMVPSLDRAGDEIVASVLRFDARDQSQRRAIRQATTQAALLQEVEPMLRELFGLPPRVEDPEGPTGPVGPVGPVTPPRPGLSAAPFVVLGAGVAALAVGIVFGAMHESSESEYRRSPIGEPATQAEVDTALALRSRAETEGIVGMSLMIGGGAIAGAGLIWLLAAGNEDGSSPLAVLPYAGPDGAGVVFAGSLEGGSL